MENKTIKALIIGAAITAAVAFPFNYVNDRLKEQRAELQTLREARRSQARAELTETVAGLRAFVHSARRAAEATTPVLHLDSGEYGVNWARLSALSAEARDSMETYKSRYNADYARICAYLGAELTRAFDRIVLRTKTLVVNAGVYALFREATPPRAINDIIHEERVLPLAVDSLSLRITNALDRGDLNETGSGECPPATAFTSYRLPYDSLPPEFRGIGRTGG